MKVVLIDSLLLVGMYLIPTILLGWLRHVRATNRTAREKCIEEIAQECRDEWHRIDTEIDAEYTNTVQETIRYRVEANREYVDFHTKEMSEEDKEKFIDRLFGSETRAELEYLRRERDKKHAQWDKFKCPKGEDEQEYWISYAKRQYPWISKLREQNPDYCAKR